MLERWDDYRLIDWASELEYPEFTNKEVNRFLVINSGNRNYHREITSE